MKTGLGMINAVLILDLTLLGGFLTVCLREYYTASGRRPQNAEVTQEQDLIMWERAHMNWRTMTGDDVQADKLLAQARRDIVRAGLGPRFRYYRNLDDIRPVGRACVNVTLS
jgi:hypothetical protein